MIDNDEGWKSYNKHKKKRDKKKQKFSSTWNKPHNYQFELLKQETTFAVSVGLNSPYTYRTSIASYFFVLTQVNINPSTHDQGITTQINVQNEVQDNIKFQNVKPGWTGFWF